MDKIIFQTGKETAVFDEKIKAVRIISEKTEIDSIYDQHYFLTSYLAKQELRKSLYRKVLNKALSFSKGPLLDIGSGAGLFLKEVIADKVSATGIEPSFPACQLAREQSSAEIINCDPLTLPANWRKNYYGIITILDVLAHTEYPDRLLKWAHNQIRSDGVLVIKTPNHPLDYYEFIWEKYKKNLPMLHSLAHIPYQRFGWDLYGLQAFVKECGFQILSAEKYYEFEKNGRFRLIDLIHPRRLLYKSRVRAVELFLKYPSILLIVKKADL